MNTNKKTRYAKSAKIREERQRSHWYEWEQDVLDYIQTNIPSNRVFLETTQKQICKEVGIPRATLNTVFKNSSKIIKKSFGKGRLSKTGLTTAMHLTELNKDKIDC